MTQTRDTAALLTYILCVRLARHIVGEEALSEPLALSDSNLGSFRAAAAAFAVLSNGRSTSLPPEKVFRAENAVDLSLLNRTLIMLNLGHTDVTDADLEHLKELTALKWLNLEDTRITDNGLQHLNGLTGLNGLQLKDTSITDAGLERLRGLTSLEDLGLCHTEVTDGGLVHLSSFPALTMLDLKGTAITDAGLEYLKSLTTLRVLMLERAEITNAGLRHLTGLTALRWLFLDGPFSAPALVDLQYALPNCSIQC